MSEASQFSITARNMPITVENTTVNSENTTVQQFRNNTPRVAIGDVE